VASYVIGVAVVAVSCSSTAFAYASLHIEVVRLWCIHSWQYYFGRAKEADVLYASAILPFSKTEGN